MKKLLVLFAAFVLSSTAFAKAFPKTVQARPDEVAHFMSNPRFPGIRDRLNQLPPRVQTRKWGFYTIPHGEEGPDGHTLIVEKAAGTPDADGKSTYRVLAAADNEFGTLTDLSGEPKTVLARPDEVVHVMSDRKSRLISDIGDILPRRYPELNHVGLYVKTVANPKAGSPIEPDKHHLLIERQTHIPTDSQGRNSYVIHKVLDGEFLTDD